MKLRALRKCRLRSRSSKDDWQRQCAFLMLRCGLTEAEARTVEPRLFQYVYELWLEDRKLEERFAARICSIVNNFAQSFSKEPKFTNEIDFMAIGKEPQKPTEFSEVVSIIKNAAEAGRKDDDG